jgi:hypothetical protein
MVLQDSHGGHHPGGTLVSARAGLDKRINTSIDLPIIYMFKKCKICVQDNRSTQRENHVTHCILRLIRIQKHRVEADLELLKSSALRLE